MQWNFLYFIKSFWIHCHIFSKIVLNFSLPPIRHCAGKLPVYATLALTGLFFSSCFWRGRIGPSLSPLPPHLLLLPLLPEYAGADLAEGGRSNCRRQAQAPVLPGISVSVSLKLTFPPAIVCEVPSPGLPRMENDSKASNTPFAHSYGRRALSYRKLEKALAPLTSPLAFGEHKSLVVGRKLCLMGIPCPFSTPNLLALPLVASHPTGDCRVTSCGRGQGFLFKSLPTLFSPSSHLRVPYLDVADPPPLTTGVLKHKWQLPHSHFWQTLFLSLTVNVSCS